MGAPTALERSTANLREGLYCAFSKRMMVSRRTPTYSRVTFLRLGPEGAAAWPPGPLPVAPGQRRRVAVSWKEKCSGWWRERVYSNITPSELKVWLVTTARQS